MTTTDIQNSLKGRRIKVAAIANDGEEAIIKPNELASSLVLMDITLKGR